MRRCANIGESGPGQWLCNGRGRVIATATPLTGSIPTWHHAFGIRVVLPTTRTSLKAPGTGLPEFVFEQHRRADATSHQLANVVREVQGDRATSDSYVTACIRTGGHDITVRGRSSDHWLRRSGPWRINERRYATTLCSWRRHRGCRHLGPAEQGPERLGQYEVECLRCAVYGEMAPVASRRVGQPARH
jgi:SnoaL-like protein